MSRKVNVFGGATIPQPLVHELPQDAAWDEWSRALEDQENKFAPTAPAPLPRSRMPGQVTLDDVLQQMRSDHAVCLHPGPWTKLYVLLAQRRQGTARLPPPPLTGKGWDSTSTQAKHMSFHAHLEWASTHGCLLQVHDFLSVQPQDAWYRG
jgi:hypothetical protein